MDLSVCHLLHGVKAAALDRCLYYLAFFYFRCTELTCLKVAIFVLIQFFCDCLGLIKKKMRLCVCLC